MTINRVEGVMRHQIDELLHIKEIIKILNSMPPPDRDYYRNLLILSILNNTITTHEEVFGILELIKLEYWDKFIKK